MSGGKWKGPKQNHEVVNPGPLFPHSFLSHETYLKWLSRKLPTKAYFRSYYRIELLHLQFFYKACTTPHHTHKKNSQFIPLKNYGNLTHNIVKGDSDSAVWILFLIATTDDRREKGTGLAPSKPYSYNLRD